MESSCETGHTLAQHNLGVMYAKGQGVPLNYKTAVTWYTLAAEKGDVSAHYSLGWMYDKGVGVTQNDKTAGKWYKLAAKQGYAGAQGDLGAMCAFGRGVLQKIMWKHTNGGTLLLREEMNERKG